MAEWNPRANDLFLRAVEIESRAELRRFLREECGGDDDLAAQVQSLLAASRKLGSFLNSPAAQPPAAIGATTSDSMPTSRTNRSVLSAWMKLASVL